MRWILELLIFVACLLQSLETGTFLTLDVTTKVLQQKWNFNLYQMVSIGTIGYSLGFLGVGLFNLLTHFPLWVNIIIAGLETSLCWFLIWMFLCPNCISWYWVIFLEAGIGMGTAIGYTSAVQIASRDTTTSRKSWKLIILALMVAIGSVGAFSLFVELSSVNLVLIIMLTLSLGASGLLLLASLVPVKQVDTAVDLPLITNSNVKVSFSKAFAFYLLALNLTFGIIMTFINSAASILTTFGFKWNEGSSSQRILAIFVLGNLTGRLISLWLKSYLAKLLWLFAFLMCLLAIFQGLLLPFWNVGIVSTILVLSSFFFGIIWSTTTLLAREFFEIEEKRSLGLVFFGMAIGPPLFGNLAGWLYSLHETGVCSQINFEVYFILASLASFLATGCYLTSWYLVWVRR